MTDDQQDGRDKVLIEREAIVWFTRMNGRPSRTDRRDFRNWLAASSEHRKAYDDLCQLWVNMGPSAPLLETADDRDLVEPLEKIRQLREEQRVGKVVGPIIAGCLAVLAVGCWFWLERPTFLQDLQADYVSKRGERREIILNDGSHILMDADTALDVSLSVAERRIRLLRGTAFFDVSHLGTPFVVEAENGEAHVLGTEFDVSMKEDHQVTVTLAKGSVKVAIAGRQKEAVLTPGESVDYGESGLGSIRKAVIEDEMAWHHGRLIFNNARLADVLAQIERYRNGRIVVIRSSLKDLRVSGNITLDNTDRALAAVQSLVGFSLHSLGKVTIIGP